MRRALSAVIIALAATAAALGQTNNVEEARKELNLGAVAYRAGRFAEAERRFRRALELDPTEKRAPLYIARSVQQQYKPGEMSPENVATGERAAAAYQDILKTDPANDDAFKAVISLYGQMKNDQKIEELLLWRANDFSAPNNKRAGAFVLLAVRQGRCVSNITEQKENKTTEQQPDKVVVKYRMPADQGDFLKARQCASDGLQLLEQALALNPKDDKVWLYKGNLLRESSKLAEMEGDAAQKAEYERQSGEALATHKRLEEEAAQSAHAAPAGDAQEAQAVRIPIETPGVPRPKKNTAVTGGILNGKALNKPQPYYPPAAKGAGAQGTVTVRIVVDEEGKVIEAAAVSGHPMLHEAAVDAARKARFTPTLLSGVPVKVTGHVTYNFVLGQRP